MAKGEILMDLMNINKFQEVSNVSAKKVGEGEKITEAADTKAQKEISLSGFEQSASAIAGIKIQTEKSVVESSSNDLNDKNIEEFIEYQTTKIFNDKHGYLPIHLANLKKMQKIHSVLKDRPEVLAQIHTTQGALKKLPMHDANLKKTQEIHSVLKDQPEVLAQIHTTKDAFGQLPIHTNNSEKIKEINEALKDQPEVLAQIHTTGDDYHRLPIHYADLEGMKEIHRALKDQPEVLAQIHTSTGMHGQTAMHLADIEGVKEIHRALKDQPEVLREIHRTRSYEGKKPIMYSSIVLLEMCEKFISIFKKE